MPAVSPQWRGARAARRRHRLDAVHATGAEGEARGVAVAVDGEVLPRTDWTNTTLDEGCHVEVLHAVQGGC